jgi:glycosyltransferase involved in cell wall biosynthesis
MILLAHPTGNAFSRALLDALLARRQLGLFATTIAFNGRETWLKLLPASLRSELLRRQFDVPSEKLFTRPARELARLALSRFGAHSDVASVYRDLDCALARELARLAREHPIAGVYAYEDGALKIFRRAQRLDLKCFYDLPIAYWETTQRLLCEEAGRRPEWAHTLSGLRDSEEKIRRKTEEAQLADVIVCPSAFVYESLPSELRPRSIVAEFGSPPRQQPPPFREPGAKLRVLFAGSMTQRKGLADLFAAMKLLKRDDLELVVMGSPLAPMDFYRREYRDFIYERPRPHHEVLKLMETCDALVLPSIVEGRALVQQEAMSCGLILIATANAGAQDLIEDGRAGFLIPIRSPEAIAERLAWLAENRSALPEMKRVACEKAAALTWRRYTDKILNALTPALQPGPNRSDNPMIVNDA